MDAASEFDRIAVVDFGAQYAQLIARRVRECRVYAEIVPHDVSADSLRAMRLRGLILSGGPKSIHEPGAPTIDRSILELGVPVLGICYGHQLIADAFGGVVKRAPSGEFGRTALRGAGGLLLDGLPDEQTVWMSHNDAVTSAPAGFRELASSSSSPVAAMEDTERGVFSVQYHPEVGHTPLGMEVLKNFLYNACDCTPSWTATNVIEKMVEAVRSQVGDARVICGLSGGVDSAVAAAIVHRAVGDQLTCIHVDNGLMRAGESEQIVETFGRHFKIDLIHSKSQDRFLQALSGVTDPERKRKVIGETFIRVFEEIASGIERGPAKFFVQGTLYPDVIESGGSKVSDVIKTHHNVGGLPEKMDFEIVEPLRDLFKDEVRKVGQELSLPEEIIWRQPFPGPGLAVRVIGEVTAERVEIVRAADAIVVDEIAKAGIYKDIWQSFAVLLPVQSVGVMGDARTYGNTVAVRAVTSEDAMTADWARLDPDLLETISSRIISEVDGVNRVAYDVTSKPPGTIEWE